MSKMRGGSKRGHFEDGAWLLPKMVSLLLGSFHASCEISSHRSHCI